MEDDAIEETNDLFILFILFVNLCNYYHNSVHKLLLKLKLVDINMFETNALFILFANLCNYYHNPVH